MKNKVLVYILLLFLTFCNEVGEDDCNRINEAKDYKLIENCLLNSPDLACIEEAVKLIIKLKNQSQNTLEYSYIHYYGRNARRIIIKKDTLIYYLDELISSLAIEKVAYEFILNRKNDPHMSQKEEVMNKNENILISKGRFFLIVEDSINIETLRKVIWSLSNVFETYKNHLSQKYYKDSFLNLDTEDKKFIDSCLYNRVLVFSMEQHKSSLSH